jgi:hypothetical protein
MINLKTGARLLLVATVLTAAGCATQPPPKQNLCADYDTRVRSLRTVTPYSLEADTKHASKPVLKKGVPMRVTDFHVAPSRPAVQPCDVIRLNKELVLHASKPASVQMLEVREFYSASGALITTRTDRLRGQFNAAGQYKGETAVPIPPGAPPGKYRVLVRLTTDPVGKRKAITLATAETAFVIQAAQ